MTDARLVWLGLGVTVVSSLALACGARTELDTFASATRPADGGTDAPVKSLAGADAALWSIPDAGAASDDAACGAPWVIFEMAAGEQQASFSLLYARRADGTSGHMLADLHPYPRAPSVSPDGAYLLYASGDAGPLDGDVYIRRFADGAEAHLQLPNGPILGTSPPTGFSKGALSPDNSLIAYSDAQGNLVLVPADGSGVPSVLVPTPNTDVGGFDVGVFVSFAPVEKRLLFTLTSSLDTVGIDGAGLQLILAIDHPESVPATFSPDGTRLVASVACDLAAASGLRIYSPPWPLANACEAGTLLLNDANANDPVWGPGGLILYIEGGIGGGDGDLHVVDVGGGEPTNLTRDLRATYGDPWSATWAPACTVL